MSDDGSSATADASYKQYSTEVHASPSILRPTARQQKIQIIPRSCVPFRRPFSRCQAPRFLDGVRRPRFPRVCRATFGLMTPTVIKRRCF